MQSLWNLCVVIMTDLTRRMILGAAWCACSLPSVVWAQQDDDLDVFTEDCNLLIECAVETPGLTYQASNDVIEDEITLHTHVSFGNRDRRCPTSGTFEYVYQTSRCTRNDGMRSSSPRLLGPTYQGSLQEGFGTHTVPLRYTASEPALCVTSSQLRIILDNGEQRQVTCAQSGGLTINKPNVAFTPLTDLEAITPFGEANPFRYEMDVTLDREEVFEVHAAETSSSYLAGFAVPRRRNQVCSGGRLDELDACSSDQSPVCGCDGRVWEGACAATRAGVAILSASPNHPMCQKTLHTSTQSRSYLSPNPDYYSPYAGDEEGAVCDVPRQKISSLSGSFVDGHAEFALWADHDKTRPHYLFPWYARISHGPRNEYFVNHVQRHDIEQTPEYCSGENYRMHTCSSLDPCCGVNPATCDREVATTVWCSNANDQDCDGLPDADEPEQAQESADSDGDGLLDREEVALGTVPGNPDTDGDGLSDGEEWQLGLDPSRVDSDDDTIPDGEDDAPRLRDRDRDGLHDGIDPFPDAPDGDFDGLLDGLDDAPDNPDRDGDGLVDGAEVLLGFDPDDPSDVALHGVDSDGDGLSDVYEQGILSNVMDADSDGDGLDDLLEIMAGSSPLLIDTDEDGLDDLEELRMHFTDPAMEDTDDDGLIDGDEVARAQSSPRLIDTDGDGLSDELELDSLGTLANRRDTDGGGFDDMMEFHDKGDPREAGDDAEQIRERYVGERLSPHALFYRSDEELLLRLHADEQRLETHNEIVSSRLIDMPYHHISFEQRIRPLEPSGPFDFSNRFILDTQNFEIERVIKLDGVRSNQARFLLTEKGTHRKLLVSAHFIFTHTRRKQGRTTEFLLSEHDVIHEMGSDTHTFPMLSHITLDDFSHEEGDLITLTTTFRVEVLQKASPEVCDNGIDDDHNGLTDCEDAIVCQDECFVEVVEVCNNGRDDDDDRLIDCMDPDCVNECVDFEICDDNTDNDGDGLIDLADPFCENFCMNGICGELCGDFRDNDGDGFVDCDDDECAEAAICLIEICGDGLDNDLNGLVDNDDPLCQFENCDDGIDNDGDGFTDCLDEKCALDFFCCNFNDTCGGEICNDGFDNDFDGLADCEDDECRGTQACIIPGQPPRRGLRDRLSEGCGCMSVTSKTPEQHIPYEFLFVACCGVLGLSRRRQRIS